MLFKELEEKDKQIEELTEQNTSLLTSVENLNKSVQELEAQIEKMKCCGNCDNTRCTSKYRGNSAYHTQIDGFACAQNEDWTPKETGK